MSCVAMAAGGSPSAIASPISAKPRVPRYGATATPDADWLDVENVVDRGGEFLRGRLAIPVPDQYLHHFMPASRRRRDGHSANETAQNGFSHQGPREKRTVAYSPR
jgi:hypothetical protein